MSTQLTSRSPDLKRLQDEGYEIEVKAGHLVLGHVPYVAQDQTVRYGSLVSTLDLQGDVTCAPGTHVVQFSGSTPCDHTGRPLDQIINSSDHLVLAKGLEVDFTFSSKPASGAYPDYYEKMATYAAILASQARVLDPEATAQTFRVVPCSAEESVFLYLDTASSRAGISAVSSRLERGNVAIVGLGGTGSYILDLVAKTPVPQIHLFDGDRFLQHNAFRSPGAPSCEELDGAPLKVTYFAGLYSQMRRGIVPHGAYLDETNVEELRAMDFVFLALDQGAAKKFVVAKLEEYGIAFIDVGMGVNETDGALSGLLRVTTSTPDQRDHVHAGNLIPFGAGDEHNEYARNIQIADLNSLNATLAVIKWKKLLGFYADLEHEHHSVYQIDGNVLTNEHLT
ncbi:ThiF family adenylyltransferase [Streptacidiphilus sp. N1-12]|uniref:ThiF family adenylyltransferase n=2 Tax=Streptacidiphilus alkalitolerans TaxID=3342712 RepID=A0ABV6WQE9_9ACTN